MSDWGGLLRYNGSDNTEIPAPAPGENRVVFIGDEITEAWGAARRILPRQALLESRHRRGRHRRSFWCVSARMSSPSNQKLSSSWRAPTTSTGRFGPGTQFTIAENIISMTELARVNGIRVVLASLTPVCDCFTNVTARIPSGKVLGVNRWLKEYAAQTGSVYLTAIIRYWLKDGRSGRS